MGEGINTSWHFSVMILASIILFLLIIRIVVGKPAFSKKRNAIVLLSVIVVVIGMLFGKYGYQWGFQWWIYYPVPMLMTVLLPPFFLKMNFKQTVFYLFLSFLSAPFIHFMFSFFLGWKEYMPFWNIPYLKTIF